MRASLTVFLTDGANLIKPSVVLHDLGEHMDMESVRESAVIRFKKEGLWANKFSEVTLLVRQKVQLVGEAEPQYRWVKEPFFVSKAGGSSKGGSRSGAPNERSRSLQRAL